MEPPAQKQRIGSTGKDDSSSHPSVVDGAGASSSPSLTRKRQYKKRERKVERSEGFDLVYPRSYAHIGLQEEIIKDSVRIETYQAAIFQHKNAIAGKVVMEVGCGTGILAILCALVGARRVYAVEASEMAYYANEIVRDNKLSDKITVLHTRVEDVKISEKVDVIISEWMGHMLLYQTRLPSVIFARDKWLKPGGLILPSHAMLFMAPVTCTERYRESVDFWRDVYGINMSALLTLAKLCEFEKACVETISRENLFALPLSVKEVNCYTVTVNEIESVTGKFRFSSRLRAPLHGFAFWFKAIFRGPVLPPSNQEKTQSPSDREKTQSPSDREKTQSPSDREKTQSPSDREKTQSPSDREKTQSPSGSAPDDQNRPSIAPFKKRLKPDSYIVLSNAPEDAATHWQQTLVYFYEPIELHPYQVIEGTVTLSQGLGSVRCSVRSLNIRLKYTYGGRAFVKESYMTI